MCVYCTRNTFTVQKIGNSDYTAYLLLGFVAPTGEKEKARNYRKVLMRYVNLAIIETLRSVSIK